MSSFLHNDEKKDFFYFVGNNAGSFGNGWNKIYIIFSVGKKRES